VTLVAVLVLIVSMMALGVSFLTIALGSTRALDASVEDRRAFYLAEAAVAESITALRAAAPGGIGSADQPARLGSGLVWCEVTDLGGGRRSILATGMCGSGRAAIEAIVSVADQEADLFRAMILSNEDLNIDSKQLIDSYDSSLGDYDSQATNELDGEKYANANGSVASNGSIVVSSDTTIFGNATPGPGEGIFLDSDAVVTGSTTSAKVPFGMPVLEPPKIPASGTLSVTGLKTLSAGNYNFGSVKLGTGARLVVRGPAVIVSGDFVTSDKSKLEIDATNGPVTFYNKGTFKYDKGTTLTTSADSPADVVFAFDSANPISFPDGINFLGGIYAPMAPINIGSDSTFYGAVVADEVTMGSRTDFHFDEFLLNRRNVLTDRKAVELLSWHEAPVSDDTLRLDRRDPIVVLGLDPDDLVPPSQAWEEAPKK